MIIILPSKTKYFLKLALPFVLLFQWTMPTIEKKRNININFADIKFEKCKDPEHSHPPLSQRETSEDPEKFIFSDLIHLYFFDKQKKFYKFSVKNDFNKPATISVLSLSYFSPSRAPPFFEV